MIMNNFKINEKKTVNDFLTELADLHCMLIPYLEDECSGDIENLEDFSFIFDNYLTFGMSAEIYDGTITEEEYDEDMQKIEKLISGDYFMPL